MDELMRARKKLRRMKGVNEAYLAEDWDDLKYKMSPRTILEEMQERMLCASPMLRKMVAAVRVGITMIQRRRARRAGYDYGCGCE